jgi:hypothetical protein
VQSDAAPDRFNQLYGIKPDIIFEYRLYLFYVAIHINGRQSRRSS